jgi:hypothetical protein
MTISDRPEWDRKLPRSILPDYDLNRLVYAISGPLHYTTGVESAGCGINGHLCPMCGNAVRLVIQAAEPKIIERALELVAHALGHDRIDLHPRTSED